MNIKRVTPIELAAGIILLVCVAAFVWLQTQVFHARDRDNARKTDINAIDNYLRYVYFPAHHSYPMQINAAALPTLDPKYLVGPNHRSINSTASSLHYNPLDCDGTSQCSSYTLRANLEQEADYIKNPA